MRRLILAACAALALSGLALTGCSLAGLKAGIPASPAAVADSTVKDEQTLRGVELAYKAARLAMETAVDAGLLKGQRATQVAAFDNRAYQAILTARAAYRTANAPGYRAAVNEAEGLVGQFLALIKGNTP